jgi:peptidoglycan/xylan/chitin deacetylase (PgdA/CDA1 family)
VSDTLVLCYHALSPDWTADLSVTPDAFAQQIEHLRRRRYHGVTFSEAVQRRARGKVVAVTFDDAFASIELARPVLEAAGWPATVYAVTDFAATARPLHWEGVSQWAGTEHAAELASLDWGALAELRDTGWEIGSHTVTHPFLTQLPDDELDRELTESRRAVEAALGSCSSIAYPYGDVDPRVVAATAAAGYTTAAALPARWNDVGALEWPRVGVYHPDDLRRFRLKSSQLVRRARGRLRR